MISLLDILFEGDRKGKKAFSYELQRLGEGKYDSLTSKLARNTMRAWKEQWERGEEELYYLEEVDTEDFLFEFEMTLELVDQPNYFSVSGGADHKGNMPFIDGKFQVSKDVLPKEWSFIYEDLVDFIRHEIEHLTQAGINLRQGKKRNTMAKHRADIDAQRKPRGKYPIMRDEIEPHLQGLYLKAKKTRTPFKDVVQDELDRKGYTEEEKKKIISIWKKYIKSLNLPSINEGRKKKKDPS